VETESQTSNLLKIAIGGRDEQVSVAHQAEVVLPLQIFSIEKLIEYSEKEQKFIQWLLSQTTLNEDKELQINDIVEKGKDEGFSEKYVRGTRESCFQERAWNKGGRILRGLTWKVLDTQ
jgi:hypothetical protein